MQGLRSTGINFQIKEEDVRPQHRAGRSGLNAGHIDPPAGKFSQHFIESTGFRAVYLADDQKLLPCISHDWKS